MIDRGHEVDIFAGKVNNVKEIHDDVKRYNLLQHTYYYNDLIPKNGFLRLFKGLLYIVKYIPKNPLAILKSLNIFKYKRTALKLNLLFQIIPFLERGPHDIVHCQYGPLALIVLRLKEVFEIKGKLVTSFRGFDVTQTLKENPGIYAELFRRGDLFLPVCKAFRQILIEAGCEGKKIIVHHSGIDLKKLHYTKKVIKKDEKLSVLTIARLVEKKGLPFAIEAIARVAASKRQLTYKIIGDGELRGDLEVLIGKLGIGSIVQLLGWKNEDAVIHLLKSSHILLAPSVTAADGNQEGIPNALKMAMAMGLPIIGTVHSGIPELVEDGVSGLLVPEGNIDTLTVRLLYLLDHPEICSQMGKEGRKKVEESFNINSLNDQLVALYNKLLDRTYSSSIAT